MKQINDLLHYPKIGTLLAGKDIKPGFKYYHKGAGRYVYKAVYTIEPYIICVPAPSGTGTANWTGINSTDLVFSGYEAITEKELKMAQAHHFYKDQ